MALILSGDTGVPASGMPTGSVIQTVRGTTPILAENTSSSSYVASSIYVDITPSSTSSKIYISSSFSIDTVTNTNMVIALYRNATILNNGLSGSYDGNYYINPISTRSLLGASIVYLDSPSTTSSIRYQIYYKSPNSTSISIRNDLQATQIIAMEIVG